MTESILEKLLRSKAEYDSISQQAHQMYDQARAEPAVFSPHQTFKVETTPPYVVFDYHMELEKQQRGHWILSELGRINLCSWMQYAEPGQRFWVLLMFDTCIYLGTGIKCPDWMEVETFLVVKRDRLDELTRAAEERNLLFYDPFFDFVERPADPSPSKDKPASQANCKPAKE